jgi:putative aldouronate transport system substrate-binding protein
MSRGKIAKVLSIALATFLALSSLVSCAQKGVPTSSGKASASTAPETITTFVDLTGPNLSTDTEVGKVIQKKFNITFKFVPVPTDFTNQCNVYLAAGDYPEVTSLPDLQTYNNYIAAGALVCLENYLPQMTNFTKERASQIPLWRSQASDGKLYKWEDASPQASTGFMSDFDADVRSDAISATGNPSLVYASDYISFLQKALAALPKTGGKKTVGFTFAGAETWGALLPFEMFEKGDTYFAANSGISTGVVVGNAKTKQFVSEYSLASAKESAKFFNTLYRDGLLDTESFQLKDADTLNKMTSGQCVVLDYGRWNTASANAGLLKNGNPERSYVELPIRLDSQQGTKRLMVESATRTNENIVITKNCKDPARYLKLVDWFQTDEAQKLYGSGVEGVDYSVQNGKRVPLQPLIDYLTGKNSNWNMTSGTMESFLYAYCLGGRYDLSPTDGQPYRITKDPNIISEYGLSDVQKATYKALGWANSKSWYQQNADFETDATLSLMNGISLDSTSDIAKEATKIQDIATQYASKIVFSKTDAEFESNYQAMLNEMQKGNIDQVVSQYNKLLATAITKLK